MEGMEMDPILNAHFIAISKIIADAYDKITPMKDYIEYIEGKIEIDEIPFTFEQWKQAEIDLKGE